MKGVKKLDVVVIPLLGQHASVARICTKSKSVQLVMATACPEALSSSERLLGALLEYEFEGETRSTRIRSPKAGSWDIQKLVPVSGRRQAYTAMILILSILAGSLKTQMPRSDVWTSDVGHWPLSLRSLKG